MLGALRVPLRISRSCPPPCNSAGISTVRFKIKALEYFKVHVKEGEIGPKIDSETAKYSMGARWNCGAMESAYKIYTLRMEYSERGAAKTSKSQHKGEISAKFKVAWADIAIMANLKVADGLKVGAKLTSETSEVRRTLTILADRHYKNAKKYITSSATASFPKI